MTRAVWHGGEVSVQRRVGLNVEKRMAEIGPLVIRDHMPEQHREFFTQLPFVIAGSVDASGQPWASVLVAPPGFMTSPDAQTLAIHAKPIPGDPLEHSLADGAAIGLLGIQPHTRRRNRMNGHVSDVTSSGFSVHVDESFGNCPKYIQAREPEYGPRDQPAPAQIASQLDDVARAIIAAADTLFIATALEDRVDVSHRGGKPGFVRADEDGTLTMPDFVGNFFFNTFGNIEANPRAGLLFIDFDNGDLLYVAVKAEIVWDGPEVQAFAGAQRLLRMKVVNVRRLDAALPLRWGSAELSPVLAATGNWSH